MKTTLAKCRECGYEGYPDARIVLGVSVLGCPECDAMDAFLDPIEKYPTIKDQNCIYSSVIHRSFCNPERCPCDHRIERIPIGQKKAEKDAR